MLILHGFLAATVPGRWLGSPGDILCEPYVSSISFYTLRAFFSDDGLVAIVIGAFAASDLSQGGACDPIAPVTSLYMHYPL